MGAEGGDEVLQRSCAAGLITCKGARPRERCQSCLIALRDPPGKTPPPIASLLSSSARGKYAPAPISTALPINHRSGSILPPIPFPGAFNYRGQPIDASQSGFPCGAGRLLRRAPRSLRLPLPTPAPAGPPASARVPGRDARTPPALCALPPPASGCCSDATGEPRQHGA